MPIGNLKTEGDLEQWVRRLFDRYNVVQPNLFKTGGSNAVTWPGGSPYSNNLIVPHGLGSVPIVVGFSAITPGPGSFEVFHYQAPDDTNLYVQAVTIGTVANPALGIQGAFYWFAG